MFFTVPYDINITGKNCLLKSIEEKPTLSLNVNTGLYILEPSLLDDIPDEFFHITHLMERLKIMRSYSRSISNQPTDWQDMRDWGEYFKLVRK